MLGAADNIIGVGNLLILGVGVLLAIPTSILAWHSIQDRSYAARQRRQEERQKQDELNRLTEMIAKKLLGEDALSDPDQAERDIKASPPLTTTLETVAHQVKPSNGITMARTIEAMRDEVRETRHDMMQLALRFGEHISNGHGGQIWSPGP